MKRNGIWRMGRSLGTAVAILALILWFFTALDHMTAVQKEEGAEQLELTLRRAAVTCYAAEGIYPPTLDYLIQHYGIQIEDERYLVFYENFADNLMPDITVLEKGAP